MAFSAAINWWVFHWIRKILILCDGDWPQLIFCTGQNWMLSSARHVQPLLNLCKSNHSCQINLLLILYCSCQCLHILFEYKRKERAASCWPYRINDLESREGLAPNFELTFLGLLVSWALTLSWWFARMPELLCLTSRTCIHVQIYSGPWAVSPWLVYLSKSA